eukprot:CAMPEP_0202028584 /NCGR_PEP_ID=MMETSP0905-20130828/63530_1 /ASSEMBLY_ACC=CAM_ASM_000554 /TAXON_ID=420261 /ORGANISM="Thalassiosira antarctica, Strain CCMP982" /LENGTH=359 /DNA_ID=CAMNT_0048592299 /DNA_START=154 /DNA_END=1230 /DNA_ORIENTATION=-
MKALHKAALLLATYLSSCHHAVAVLVGDEVCITGYVMDNFCIFDNQGFLLDNRDVTTLQNPEDHSFHCLMDVDFCFKSGFQVLGEKDPDTDRHCLGFRLDDTDAVLAAGRALGKRGYCTTCTGGDSDRDYGFLATVKGTVKEIGDGSSDVVTGTPILTNVTMLDESVGCDGNPTLPPLCVRSLEMTPTAPTNLFAEPALECPSELTQVTPLNNGALTLYTEVVVSPTSDSESILCVRLESDSESWVSFGISPTGLMFGANAIIGNAAYDSVQKYNSTLDVTKQKPFAAMDETHQTLMNTKVTQEDGKTVVSFSKYLKEEGENEILAEGENTFLWAVGSSNAPGYHAARGEFTLDFTATA